MIKWAFILLLFSLHPTIFFAQQNFEPIGSFYKDQLWQLAPTSSSFLPITQSKFDLRNSLRDSSKQYFWLTQKLFKEYLFEIKGDGYRIEITPLINIARGKDLEDTNIRSLFDNTRGVQIEVDLQNKFSFSTSYYENQNRFSLYESSYYSSIGERYPDLINTYRVENAVVPGAARTKPFKEDGYDYGYAIGTLVFAPKKWITFSMGNNAQFVGKGYRSLLLSDNSVPATYFRTDLHFRKLNYTLVRSKVLDLIRRPYRTTVESYYEPKLFSNHFLSWSPFKGLELAYFEGSIWHIGDSVSTKSVDPIYYNPVPFISQFVLQNDSLQHTINGLQVSYSFGKAILYSQLALSFLETDKASFQLGGRWYSPFGVKNLMLQGEYNNVPNGIYAARNNRMNYAQYNLPIAHVKGQGFEEVVFRINYSYKRAYIDWKSIHYSLHNYQNTSLVVAPIDYSKFHASIYHQQIEIGYRFNSLMNLKAFIRSVYRASNELNHRQTSVVVLGVSTDLIHHYNDF